MEERPNFFERYDRQIPQQYRNAGWRVLEIVPAGMARGNQAFTAVLQNDALPQPNGYFHSLAKTKEDALNLAVQKLLENVKIATGFTWYFHSDVILE